MRPWCHLWTYRFVRCRCFLFAYGFLWALQCAGAPASEDGAGTCSAEERGACGGQGRTGSHGLFARLVTSASGSKCDHVALNEDYGDSWRAVKKAWLYNFPKELLGGTWNTALEEVVRRIGKQRFERFLSTFVEGEVDDIELAISDVLQNGPGARREVSRKTQIQKVEIWNLSSHDATDVWGVEHPPYALYLGGYIQSSGLDEMVYHSVMAHTPLLAHPRPKSVFIGGSGEGFLLREVLRHNTVQDVVMVDIDGELMEIAQERLSAFHQGSFRDSRAEVVTGDARAHLETVDVDRLFDVIALDFNEFYFPKAPTDPSTCLHLGGLFSQDFYGVVKRRLRPGGIVVSQAPGYHECPVRSSLLRHFKFVSLAAVPMVSYPFNLFFVASDSLDVVALSAADADSRIKERIIAPSPGQADRMVYSGALYTQLWDLHSRLEARGLLPCGGDCLLVDQPGGAQDCADTILSS